MKPRTMLSLTLVLQLCLTSGAQAKPPVKHDAHAHQHHQALPATAPTDSESVFQLGTVFENEAGNRVPLASFAGAPTLIVMFYGTCKTMCPILVEDARRVDNALTPAERARFRVVLVTLDPARDTPERLRALATERKLDLPRWTFLRGADRDIRELSMVLGVQYRKLENGDFAHSAVLSLLDEKGRITSRIEGLAQPNDELVSKLRALLHSKPPKEAPSGSR